MLTEHEFKVLVHRLKYGVKRKQIDVDRIILEAEELRSLLKRVKVNVEDRRELLGDMLLL